MTLDNFLPMDYLQFCIICRNMQETMQKNVSNMHLLVYAKKNMQIKQKYELNMQNICRNVHEHKPKYASYINLYAKICKNMSEICKNVNICKNMDSDH